MKENFAETEDERAARVKQVKGCILCAGLA